MDIVDLAGDTSAGMRTVPVVVGTRHAGVIGLGLILTGCWLASTWIKERELLLLAVVIVSVVWLPG
jgi:4-hydroxybenzoate polyprenyltransferase